MPIRRNKQVSIAGTLAAHPLRQTGRAQREKQERHTRVRSKYRAHGVSFSAIVDQAGREENLRLMAKNRERREARAARAAKP